MLYATGEGLTNPPVTEGVPSAQPFAEPVLPVALLAGGREIPLQFKALAPGFAGLLQLNGQLPEDAPQGGAVPVHLRIGNAASPDGVVMTIGPRFTISNMRAGPAQNNARDTTIPVTVDFDDPSGSAASGRINYNVVLLGGQVRGFGDVTAQAAGGSLMFTIVIPGAGFTPGVGSIRVSLTNQLGIQSNELSGEFRAP
ncbi:MAG: hypothetical protein ACRD44_05615 [Bryobacteraceae bacterium]